MDARARTAATVAKVASALSAAACAGLSSSAGTQENGGLAFPRCMRHRGVPACLDPVRDGVLPKRTAQQVGVAAATLQAAQSACIHLAPNGGRPTSAQVAQYRSPDPDSRGHIDIGPGTAVDVNSPQFQAAYEACRSRLAP